MSVKQSSWIWLKSTGTKPQLKHNKERTALIFQYFLWCTVCMIIKRVKVCHIPRPLVTSNCLSVSSILKSGFTISCHVMAASALRPVERELGGERWRIKDDDDVMTWKRFLNSLPHGALWGESTGCKVKAPHFWPFEVGIRRSPMDSHYSDVKMSPITFQITSLTIVYSTVYSAADQRKHQSSASLAFVRGIHRWPVNSPYKGPLTRKILPFDDAMM